MTLTFGTVCSGIGAPEVAWQPLGWRSVFASEIEAFPRAVFKHRHPETPLHGDFTTIRVGDYPAVNVLCGGTPCQSFSVAGLRGGMADARGNLALEYLRLAERLRPQWLVWENVSGVLSSKAGRDFGAFVGGLAELGYGFAYRVLDAQYFGLAQQRQRVFVVGCLGDWRRAAAVLFEPASLRWHPAPSREASKAVGAITANGVGTCGADDNQAQARHLIARSLTAHPSRSDGETETFVTHCLRGEGFDASEDGTGRGVPLVPTTFSWTCVLTFSQNWPAVLATGLPASLGNQPAIRTSNMSDTETKPERAASSIDYDGGIVYINAPGAEPGVYKLDDLGFPMLRSLALRGLRNDLRVGDTAKTWANLLAGKIPTKAVATEKAPKLRKLSAVLEAAAHAGAENTVKAAGVRAAPGKRLTDTAEFKAALDDARQVVATWDKARTKEAGRSIKVIEWMAKLAGEDTSIEALFAAPKPAPVEMAEAAD